MNYFLNHAEVSHFDAKKGLRTSLVSHFEKMVSYWVLCKLSIYNFEIEYSA